MYNGISTKNRSLYFPQIKLSWWELILKKSMNWRTMLSISRRLSAWKWTLYLQIFRLPQVHSIISLGKVTCSCNLQTTPWLRKRTKSQAIWRSILTTGRRTCPNSIMMVSSTRLRLTTTLALKKCTGQSIGKIQTSNSHVTATEAPTWDYPISKLFSMMKKCNMVCLSASTYSHHIWITLQETLTAYLELLAPPIQWFYTKRKTN